MEEELCGEGEGQIPRGENIRAPREDSLLPSFVRLQREDKEKVNLLVRLIRLRCIQNVLSTAVDAHDLWYGGGGSPAYTACFDTLNRETIQSIRILSFRRFLTDIQAGSYRASQVVVHLGWVDLDLGCSTTLPGQ